MFDAKKATEGLNRVKEYYRYINCNNYQYEVFKGDHEFNVCDDFINTFVNKVKE